MTADEAMQIEANAFAMELLMPFDWIKRDMVGIDLCDDRAVEKLARKYRVPSATMAIRLGEVREELLSSAAQGPVEGSRDAINPPPSEGGGA